MACLSLLSCRARRALWAGILLVAAGSQPTCYCGAAGLPRPVVHPVAGARSDADADVDADANAGTAADASAEEAAVAGTAAEEES